MAQEMLQSQMWSFMQWQRRFGLWPRADGPFRDVSSRGTGRDRRSDPAERGSGLVTPVIDLSQGRVVAAEWSPPQKRSLGLELIENELDCAVHSVCTETSDEPHLRLYLSFSSLRVPMAVLREALLALCGRTGISPATLCLEIDENGLCDLDNGMIGTIYRLHADGFGLCLKNYGGGRRTLDVMRLIPLERVMLDPLFIGAIESQDRKLRNILDGLIGLAHRYGAQCIAPAINLASQREYLLARKVTLGKGTLFGSAVPVTAWHRENVSFAPL